MSVTYKVLVLKFDSSKRNDYTGGSSEPEVLFEVGSPNPARLLGYAPSEVAAALTELVYATAPDQPIMQGVAGHPTVVVETENGGLIETGDPAPAAGGDSPASTPLDPFPATPNKPRRPRRTKEQIAADKAAAEAQASGGAPLPAEPEPQVETAPPADPLHTAEDQAAPAPAPSAFVTTTTLESVKPVPAEPEIAAPETPGVPPAAPYNPFL